MERPTPLEEAILRTAAWFAGMEYPVTAFELWKWAYRPPAGMTLGEVEAALAASEVLRAALVRQEGMYALAGSDLAAWTRERRARARDARRKFAKLRRAARLLARVPSIRFVAAANTLAFWHTRPESDIDLFILTENGTIWSTRFFCVAPAALLRARPGENGDDPFCFSFFASEAAQNLSPLRLPDGEDPYFAYWLASLVPVMGDGAEFFAANAWVREELPNALPRASHEALYVSSRRVNVGIRWLERPLGAFQRKRLPARLKEQMGEGTNVVVTDEVLKFHEADRRAALRDAWTARCRGLGGENRP